MDNVTLFVKNEKELETQLQRIKYTVRIWEWELA